MRGPEGVNILQEEQSAQIQAVQTHLCSESEDFHQHSTTRKKKPHYSRHTDNGTIKKRFFTFIKSKIEGPQEGLQTPNHVNVVPTLCIYAVLSELLVILLDV